MPAYGVNCGQVAVVAQCKGMKMADLAKMFGAHGAGGFLGFPVRSSAKGAQIAVIGAGSATPYDSVGAYCMDGPAAIRAGVADYTANAHHMNFDLMGPVLPPDVAAVDLGDLPVRADDTAAARRLIRDTVADVLDAGAVPVLLGGDDSLPTPMLEAFEGRGPLVILQIDAHIDWRDEVNGERLGLSSTMRRASEMAHVLRIVQVGARGIGSARVSDYEDAKHWGAQFVTGVEVSRNGGQRAIDLIPEGSDVVICFDCDALDPSVMPAVIAPTAGGLTYAQALELIEAVAAKARIAAFDLVEFMPAADINGLGARTAGQLAAAVIGLIARQAR